MKNVIPLFSVISLIYMRYYEVTLYYRNMKIYDITYSYIAIPAFFVSFTAYIVGIIINTCKIRISVKVHYFLKKLLKMVGSFYLGYWAWKIFGASHIVMRVWNSKWSLLYVVIGVMSSFAFYSNKSV